MSNSSMGSDRQRQVQLDIHGHTPLTEISVRNARFRPLELDTNVGSTSLMVEPGVYEVSFSTGSVISNQTVAVLPSRGQITVNQEDLTKFPSANPMIDTSTHHEWHHGAAEDISKEIHASLGGSSKLFVFVRDVGTPIVTQAEVQSKVRSSRVAKELGTWSLGVPTETWWPDHGDWTAPAPSQGLSLHHSNGTEVCDLTQVGLADDDYHLFGASIELPAGNWRLRVTDDDGKRFEIPVVTNDSWQTQIFALSCAKFANQGIPRANLDSASIAMSPHREGYCAASQDRFLEETAFQALKAGRALRGDALNELLHGKFMNPIWGLVGAHLLLLRKKPDLHLLDTVINNTENILGGGPGPHPDITALRYKQAMLQGDDLSGHPSLPFPPILRRSWNFALEASHRRPDLIPLRSLSQVIASSLVGNGPWLTWVNAENMEPSSPVDIDTPPKIARSAIGDVLLAWTPDGARRATDNIVTMLNRSDATKLVFVENILQDFDREVVLQLHPEIDPAVKKLVNANVLKSPTPLTKRKLVTIEGDPSTPVEWLSDRLRVPPNTVVRSLSRIQNVLMARLKVNTPSD
jgi:hypothetical protein